MTPCIAFYVEQSGALRFCASKDFSCQFMKDFKQQYPQHQEVNPKEEINTTSLVDVCQYRYRIAKTLWQQLGNVPVNDDGELEEAFLHFESGTDREDIWSWFEEETQVPVYLLMFPKH